MNKVLHQSPYMVLRKTPFQETSLIVSGISPAYGRIDFLIKGARGISKKKFPPAELFRELYVEFYEPKNAEGLANLSVCEPVSDHDAIVNNTEGYLAACDLAAFLLRNTRPMVEIPLTYSACSRMLQELAVHHGSEPWILLIKFVFFRENGLMPDPTGEAAERQTAVLNRLIAYACGQDPALPRFSKEQWDRILLWIRSLENYHSSH